jgi:predicted N-acetyltransferase YhbS
VAEKVARDVEVRAMRPEDLEAVLDITNAAFGELFASRSGHKPDGPLFAEVMGRYRLELDPAGCHVAVTGREIVGANFSILRGTVGWFGPLAVRPDHQGHGIAQRLVAECIRSAELRGARLVGLETLANSPQHIHLYMKLGFRPSWTGINYTHELRDERMPRNVEVNGVAPKLDYVYPGFDAIKDAQATLATKVGVTLKLGEGFAICHTTNTLWADAALAYAPLVVAPDRDTFETLIGAVEAIALEQGKMRLVTQVPGSSWHTQEVLLERGYKPGGAALRMKRGEHADYDAGAFYYCDDWH